MTAMRSILPVLAAAALLAACAATTAPPQGPASTPAASPPVPAPERRDVSYRCDDGELLQLRFFPQQGVAVLVRDGRTLEMQQEPAASGFLYRAGQTVVRGQGEEILLEFARRAPRRCMAQ